MGNCPTCKRKNTILGICKSKECYSGNDMKQLTMCIHCYDEHLLDDHYHFETYDSLKLSVEIFKIPDYGDLYKSGL